MRVYLNYEGGTWGPSHMERLRCDAECRTARDLLEKFVAQYSAKHRVGASEPMDPVVLQLVDENGRKLSPETEISSELEDKADLSVQEMTQRAAAAARARKASASSSPVAAPAPAPSSPKDAASASPAPAPPAPAPAPVPAPTPALTSSDNRLTADWLRKANEYRERSNLRNAQVMFEHVLQVEPNHAEASRGIADLLLDAAGAVIAGGGGRSRKQTRLLKDATKKAEAIAASDGANAADACRIARSDTSRIRGRWLKRSRLYEDAQ